VSAVKPLISGEISSLLAALWRPRQSQPLR
jgi:hypothetical protein